MRPPTTFAAAGLLCLAFAAFAANALFVNGGAAGSHAARAASPPQDAATPPPGTRCVREKGERCKRPGEANNAPYVSLKVSEMKVTLPCPEGQTSQTCTPSDSLKVQLQTTAEDPDGDTLLYTYTTTGGRIMGVGAEVTWDTTGLQPGTYTATVEVDDCCGCIAFASAQVKVENCSDCAASK